MLKVIHAKGNVLDPNTYLESDHIKNKGHVNIIHGCNAQGVMGSGLALQVKSKHFGAYEKYAEVVENASGNTSKLLGTYSHYRDFGMGYTIINAITQENYGLDKSVRYTSYDAVDNILIKIANVVKKREFKSAEFIFAIPKKFASDRGNADWDTILKMFEGRLGAEGLGNVVLYVVEYSK